VGYPQPSGSLPALGTHGEHQPSRPTATRSGAMEPARGARFQTDVASLPIGKASRVAGFHSNKFTPPRRPRVTLLSLPNDHGPSRATIPKSSRLSGPPPTVHNRTNNTVVARFSRWAPSTSHLAAFEPLVGPPLGVLFLATYDHLAVGILLLVRNISNGKGVANPGDMSWLRA